MNINKLKNQASKCKRCRLFKTRRNVVFGEGRSNAKIMFIGEAPGKQEDLEGKPFCGMAGNILDNILLTVKIERKNIYITSILKCRPPRNRLPKNDEIDACYFWLEKQIKFIKPKIIVLFGNVATKRVLGLNLSKIMGKIITNKIKYIPTYHPAAVLYNRKLQDIIVKDIAKIKHIGVYNEKSDCCKDII
ncbi:MAG: uracil-DNA glycosylase [Candidatus Aenigmatarchaeota archaeon]